MAEKTPKKARTHRVMVDLSKKEEMLAVLIRNEEAYAAVTEMLTPAHLRPSSDALAVIWKVVQASYENYRTLPSKATLLAELTAYQGANPAALGEEDEAQINDFVDYAFDIAEHGKDIATSKACVRSALDTCRLVLEEFVATSLQSEIVRSGMLPIQLPHILEKSRSDLEAIQALGEGDDLEVPFPDGWDTAERLQLVSTGVEMLDDLIGGGLEDGETLLYMGPFGSNKTTVAVHGAAESVYMADQLLRRGETRDGKIPTVVLIFTEGTKTEYRIRLLSHLARIPRNRLARMKSIKSLSKSRKPGDTPETKYELGVFKNTPKEDFHSERYRVRHAMQLFNKHLLMIDCTDSDKNGRPLGRGGAVELANMLRGYFRKHPDRYPLVVYLDHLSALALRYIEANLNGDLDKHLRHVLRTMPNQLSTKIAKAQRTRLILFHQLSGDANKRGAAAKFHHSDAAECKSVAEFVDFAVVTGPPDTDQLCKIACTKHRREPPTEEKFVRVLGQFNLLQDETAAYTRDPATGRTIAREILTAISQFGREQERQAAAKHGTHKLD